MIPEEQRLEMIIFMSRKLHWTKDEIGKLTPAQFIKTYNELAFQESVDRWENQYNLATLMATIHNAHPKPRGARALTVKDFYTVDKPSKHGRIKEKIDKIAEEVGIKLPKN